MVLPAVRFGRGVSMVVRSELWDSIHRGAFFSSFQSCTEVEIDFGVRYPALILLMDIWGWLRKTKHGFSHGARARPHLLSRNNFLLEVVRCWENNWKQLGIFSPWILQNLNICYPLDDDKDGDTVNCEEKSHWVKKQKQKQIWHKDVVQILKVITTELWARCQSVPSKYCLEDVWVRARWVPSHSPWPQEVYGS